MMAAGRTHGLTSPTDEDPKVTTSAPVDDQAQRPREVPCFECGGPVGGMEDADDHALNAGERNHQRHEEKAGEEPDRDAGRARCEQHETDEPADDQVGDYHGSLQQSSAEAHRWQGDRGVHAHHSPGSSGVASLSSR